MSKDENRILWGGISIGIIIGMILMVISIGIFYGDHVIITKERIGEPKEIEIHTIFDEGVTTYDTTYYYRHRLKIK
jgi:hypothetical protein